MWYEVLLPSGIICVCLAAPHAVAYGVNYLVFGRGMRRNLRENWDLSMYLRDGRLTGKPWIRSGLENIPDAE